LCVRCVDLPFLSDLNIRQNYRKETEDGVNKQIVVEMKAFYMYRDMVRRCVASPEEVCQSLWSRFITDK
jgi:hypothetical protein